MQITVARLKPLLFGKLLAYCNFFIQFRNQFGRAVLRFAAFKQKYLTVFGSIALSIGLPLSAPSSAWAMFYGFNQQAQAYEHEGDNLMDTGYYEQAISAYSQAINLLPYDAVQGRADALYARAVANDVAGHFDQASQDYSWARDYYLKAAQYANYGGSQAAEEGLTGGYDANFGQQLANLVRWRATVNPNSPDYFVDGGPMKAWSLRKMPLKVYIDDSQGTGWSQDLRDLIWRAISSWTNVSGSPIRFTQWYRADDADYIITRPSSSGQIAVGSGGFTSGVDEAQSENGKVMLKQSKSLLSCPGYDGSGYSQIDRNRLYNLALHECGHALGIGGHSPSGMDVMYWKAPILKLSDRDGATLRRMYSQ